MPVFGFILGASIGSFLNVCIDRLPRGQSLVFPPSHCPDCGQKLRFLDLIPIFSYLWLRGRCRYCGAKIPWRILAVELGNGILFALLVFQYGLSIQFLVLAFYTCVLLTLAVIDLEHGLLLNKIVYPAVGISLVLAPFWPSLGFPRSFLGETTMLNSFLSSFIGGTVFATFFLLIILLYKGSMGWGDVKMAALIGLATGFPAVLVTMVVTFITGGLVAILLLLLRLKNRKAQIPYGPFLAIGAFVALLWGSNIIAWYLNFY